MRKSMEEKKQDLIEGMVTARSSVLKAVNELPAACLNEIFLGSWSVKDLLAHLVGWDFTNLQAIQEILSGQFPAFFQYYDKDWRTYNSHLVELYRKETMADLLAEVEASHQQLVDFLKSRSAAELVNGKARSEKGRTATIRNLLLSEASDESQHADQVRAFQRQI